MKRTSLFFMMILVFGALGYGQKIAVKTNALYWATATPNLAVEIGLGKRVTLDIAGGYNPFEFKDYRRWKHYLIQPEIRYWFCERFNGHFIGLHSGYMNYNVSRLPLLYSKDAKNYNYEGWLTGVGLSYGYQWILGKRWNLEAEVGVGYVHTSYSKYDVGDCGKCWGEFKKDYFAPTKAAISIVYLIK